MEKLINIANVAAGCGIEALFITQDKGQIESVYGKGDTASILGSCVTSRIFGLVVPNSKPPIGPRTPLAIRRCWPAPNSLTPNSARTARPPPPSSGRS